MVYREQDNETETGVAYKSMVVARPETFSNPVTSAVLSNSRAVSGAALVTRIDASARKHTKKRQAAAAHYDEDGRRITQTTGTDARGGTTRVHVNRRGSINVTVGAVTSGDRFAPTATAGPLADFGAAARKAQAAGQAVRDHVRHQDVQAGEAMLDKLKDIEARLVASPAARAAQHLNPEEQKHFCRLQFSRIMALDSHGVRMACM